MTCADQLLDQSNEKRERETIEQCNWNDLIDKGISLERSFETHEVCTRFATSSLSVIHVDRIVLSHIFLCAGCKESLRVYVRVAARIASNAR